MKKTALVLDKVFKEHLTGAGHPERPERIDAIERALNDRGLIERCLRISPALAEIKWILLNHSAEHVQRFESACSRGDTWIDYEECPITHNSFRIALLASGSLLSAVDAVMEGTVSNAFCVVRPPGHHAEFDRAMGFCFFNNVAIAARYLKERHKLKRVAIVDFDVHHGNGTQHSFESDPSVFFASLHGHPHSLWPGSGFETEAGEGAGLGSTMNIPMHPGSRCSHYKKAFKELLLPKLEKFQPEFLLISAGFDAHMADPIGNQALDEECYAWMSDQLIAHAQEHSHGRIASVLEGGYNLEALGSSAAVHLERLLKASAS